MRCHVTFRDQSLVFLTDVHCIATELAYYGTKQSRIEILVEADEMWTCDDCNRTFAGKKGCRRFQHCRRCPKSGEAQLHQTPSKPLRCDQCLRLFKTSLGLQEHWCCVSEVAAPRCDVCDKSYPVYRVLADHVVREHLQDRRKRICGSCNRLIVGSHWNKHQRIHDTGMQA